MQKHILLVVDNSPGSLGLAADLKAAEPGWEVAVAHNAPEALEHLQGQPVDAVVCELSLPGLDGAQFLHEVMQRHPRPLRFVLSDAGMKTGLIRCIGAAHRFLPKACDGQTLRAALERAFTLDVWLPNEAASKLFSSMEKLPSPPELYFRVVRALYAADASLDVVGDMIAQDPSMTAKILQAANSASTALQHPVVSPFEAVQFLGVESTRSLILLAHTYSYFDQLRGAGVSVEALWRHSLRCGRIARQIAAMEEAGTEVAEAAYTAGILHDIGKLALASHAPLVYAKAANLIRAGTPSWEAEMAAFGATHAEMGACLAAIWGLPPAVVEAIAFHHHPARYPGKSFCALTTVHGANAIEHALSERQADIPADRDYLAGLKVADRLEVWREACRGITQD
jgi:putative nucleotidyltransferase with HDIG domain